MRLSSVFNNSNQLYGRYTAVLVLFTFLTSCSLHSSDPAVNSQSEAGLDNEIFSTYLRLHDIWALESIQGNSIGFEGIERPSLELNLTEMKVMGTDGCNHFFGSIDRLDENDISFGPIAGTRKYCMPMTIPDLFNKQLGKVLSYEIQGLKLRLFDASGDELLGLKKVD